MKLTTLLLSIILCGIDTIAAGLKLSPYYAVNAVHFLNTHPIIDNMCVADDGSVFLVGIFLNTCIEGRIIGIPPDRSRAEDGVDVVNNYMNCANGAAVRFVGISAATFNGKQGAVYANNITHKIEFAWLVKNNGEYQLQKSVVSDGGINGINQCWAIRMQPDQSIIFTDNSTGELKRYQQNGQITTLNTFGTPFYDCVDFEVVQDGIIWVSFGGGNWNLKYTSSNGATSTIEDSVQLGNSVRARSVQKIDSTHIVISTTDASNSYHVSEILKLEILFANNTANYNGGNIEVLSQFSAGNIRISSSGDIFAYPSGDTWTIYKGYPSPELGLNYNSSIQITTTPTAGVNPFIGKFQATLSVSTDLGGLSTTYYTLDGSDPGDINSQRYVYTVPFDIYRSCFVNARQVSLRGSKGPLLQSPVYSVKTTPPTITRNVGNGLMSISAANDIDNSTVILYTINSVVVPPTFSPGSSVPLECLRYISPTAVPLGTTVRARAYRRYQIESDVVVVTF